MFRGEHPIGDSSTLALEGIIHAKAFISLLCHIWLELLYNGLIQHWGCIQIRGAYQLIVDHNDFPFGNLPMDQILFAMCCCPTVFANEWLCA